jgi:hypothetical protein
MGVSVRLFDLFAVFPPHAYNVYEIGIMREQTCETRNVMRVPALTESGRQLFDLVLVGGSWDGRTGLSGRVHSRILIVSLLPLCNTVCKRI